MVVNSMCQEDGYYEKDDIEKVQEVGMFEEQVDRCSQSWALLKSHTHTNPKGRLSSSLPKTALNVIHSTLVKMHMHAAHIVYFFSFFLNLMLKRKIAIKTNIKIEVIWTSLEVQWLRLCASTAGGTGSIPGQGTKILHATRRSQKKKGQK